MSLDSDDEDFAEFGNPLEPLDEESLPRKKVPSVTDQIATDKYGRRRFHGAFTGGFSAGFFNSVGSLEGWTPSTFKSSRSDKAKASKQKPEDFMDEEDMDEFGIAPKVLRATSDFNDSNLKRKKSHLLNDGPIPGEPVLNEIVQPARETVGIRLLMKMGWKPGQGVGPRVTKTEKKRMKEEYQKSETKVYGCSRPQDVDHSKQSDVECSSTSDDENYQDITFAPEDLQPAMCKPKDNCFGLGYSGLDRRPILSGHINLFEPAPLKMKENKKKVLIAGQAFGVGAFEEEDEDIYSREDMSQYDFALDSTPTTSKLKSQRSRFDTLPNYAGEILEGFVLGRCLESFKKHFPPPLLPQGFQPKHVPRKSRFETVDASVNESRKKGLQRHNITAIERAVILEESASKSVPQNIEIIETNVEIKHESPEDSEKLTVSTRQEHSKFRPFIADPDKEKRYEKFLELSKKGQKDRLSYYQPLTMTEWEKEREKIEFEQAARLYQPLSGMMSDRFVSASQAEDLNDPLPPLSKPIDKDSDKKAAVKMKMFGRLTREEFDWRPCSLLCKRFNVPELFPGAGKSSDVSTRKSKFSVFDFLDAATYNKSKGSSSSPEPDKSREMEDITGPAEITIKEEENEQGTESQENELLIPLLSNEVSGEQKSGDSLLEFPDPPAKVDLFKAIFLSSSEESGSDNDEEEKAEEQSSVTLNKDSQPSNTPQKENTVSTLMAESTIENTKRNKSPPRGVFANLDLDAINARRKEKHKDTSENMDQASVNNNKVNDEDIVLTVVQDKEEINEEMYGPCLPSVPSVVSKNPIAVSSMNRTLSSVVTSVNCEWVEKTEKSIHKEKHKKHKKSSKHKKHKSKSKHKKKKH